MIIIPVGRMPTEPTVPVPTSTEAAITESIEAIEPPEISSAPGYDDHRLAAGYTSPATG
jgi:hypothetical protein